MSKNPITRPIQNDDNETATKGDVRRAVEELAQITSRGFQQTASEKDLENFVTKDDLRDFESRLDDRFATKQQVETVLEIVQSIDQQLRECKQIPAKVERLHSRIFGSRQ